MDTLKPISIDKERKVHAAHDFAFLRKMGLDYVQKLSGKNWTDYNLHDPGVTILEQLCYAITDLSYRSNFDMKDILTAYGNERIEPGKNALFTPSEVLSTNPVTINDLRKVLLDRIKVIDNIWLHPISLPGNAVGFSGLYKVLIQASKRFEIDSRDNQQLRFDLLKEVRTELLKFRNICEDIGEVKLLEPQVINIQADILVSPRYSPEDVLARVFYEIEKYLYRRVSFYTLQELLQKGISINDVINGPKLDRGYILDVDLKEKLEEVSVSTINKLIMLLDGVENVKGLTVAVQGEKVHNDILLLGADHHPVLNTEYNNEFSSYTIKAFKNNYEYPVRPHIVDNTLRELWASSHRSYRVASIKEKDIEIPKGTHLDIQDYDSIQNHFPGTYLLGKSSLPRSASNLRKSQVRQLKGYLLFFEQVLANYFSQVHHTRDLFSYDESPEAMHTYFSQPLFNVPDVGPLLRGFEHFQFSSNGRHTSGSNGFASHAAESYLQGLDVIDENDLDREERKNRLLDHLLARFGMKVPALSISSFDRYYRLQQNDGKRSTAVQLKSRLLDNYTSIGYFRGKAMNYCVDPWKEDESEHLDEKEREEATLSGLERKVGMLLHIQNLTKRILSDTFSANSIQVLKDKIESSSKEKEVTKANWQDESLMIELDEAMIAEPKDLDGAGEDGSFVFKGRNKRFIQNILKNGIQVKNYRIGRLKVDFANQLVTLYKDAENEHWTVIGKHSNAKNAKAALSQLIELLTDLSVESEGYHLVEHLLIRPSSQNKQFGFAFLDPFEDAFLEGSELSTFEERLVHINQALECGVHGENYYTERLNTTEYGLVLHNKEGKTIGRSHMKFNLEEYNSGRAESEVKRIVELIKNIKEERATYFPQITLYTELTNSYRLDEKHINFQASVVLPDWPARFQDESFKAHLERTFKENAPANVKLNFVWLNLFEMKEFETLYNEWSDQKMKLYRDWNAADSNLPDEGDSLTPLSNDMLMFLFSKLARTWLT